jgi:ubiquinone/menaquinone biosynthesis C-methylase UbiE
MDMKEDLVGEVFRNVAEKYDVMNDAMSFGVHRLWKDSLMRSIAPGPTASLLDVAGGTGIDASLTSTRRYCISIPRLHP